MNDGIERTLAALGGEFEHPPVCGVSFVAPGLLRDARGDSPADSFAASFASVGLDFAFVPSWEPWAGRLVGLLRIEGIASLWVAPGVLGPALDSVGIAEGLRATARDPESLAAPLDAARDAMLASIALGVGLRADAVVIADDLAGASGPLVAPDFVADEVMPRLRDGARACAAAGKPAILHSDGETSVFLRGLAAAGFAGLHAGGVPAEVFERLHARARREGLAILGGLVTADLEHGPPRAVLAGTRAFILAHAGGLLIADDGGISTPDEYAALRVALSAARGAL